MTTTKSLTTTVPVGSGIIWLTGYRAHNTTARFVIRHDNHGGTVLAHNGVEWQTAHRYLAPIVGVANVAAILRSVLP